jgi:hypothetical protein
VFGRATTLENDVVQTTGSADVSLATGVASVLTVLPRMGYPLDATVVPLVALLGGARAYPAAVVRLQRGRCDRPFARAAAAAGLGLALYASSKRSFSGEVVRNLRSPPTFETPAAALHSAGARRSDGPSLGDTPPMRCKSGKHGIACAAGRTRGALGRTT